jgi:hypothetical protein
MTRRHLQPTDLEKKHNYKKLQWRPKENGNEWTYNKKGKGLVERGTVDWNRSTRI